MWRWVCRSVGLTSKLTKYIAHHHEDLSTAHDSANANFFGDFKFEVRLDRKLLLLSPSHFGRALLVNHDL